MTSWLRRSPNQEPVRGWFWVAVGLLAILVAIYAQALDFHGYLERGSSWWRPVITFPAYGVLLLAWWQLGPLWRRPLITAAVWALPMIFTLPMHSRDAYAYAAQGWFVSHGLDPYGSSLGQAGPPGLLVGVHWHKTTAVYPAGSVELFGVISRLTQSDFYWTVVALRVPNLIALALFAWVLPKLGRRFGVAAGTMLWAGVLNPIVLVQWIGGIHNDAVMVALAACAFLAVLDRGWNGWRGLIVAGTLLGLAMSFKQSAAIFGLGVVALGWSLVFPQRKGWLQLAARAALPGALTLLVFVLTSLRLGFGWRAPTAGNPVAATSNAPLSWVASFLRYHELLPSFEAANSLVTAISSLLIASATIVLWYFFGPTGNRVGKPWVFAMAVLVASCVLGPALQPWYLTWLLPFYALCRLDLRWDQIWLTVVVAFTLLPALQDFIAAYTSMAIVAVVLVFLWRAMRKQGEAIFPTPHAVAEQVQ